MRVIVISFSTRERIFFLHDTYKLLIRLLLITEEESNVFMPERLAAGKSDIVLKTCIRVAPAARVSDVLRHHMHTRIIRVAECVKLLLSHRIPDSCIVYTCRQTYERLRAHAHFCGTARVASLVSTLASVQARSQ